MEEEDEECMFEKFMVDVCKKEDAAKRQTVSERQTTPQRRINELYRERWQNRIVWREDK